MKILIWAAAMLACTVQADTVYLCKAYSGGTFWASSHCNQHQAHIERLVSVPNGLPWDQKVNLAEQDAAQRRRAEQASQAFTENATAQTAGECKALDARIKELDSLARQPQSGQMQDWIATERKAARDRQFRIRCQ